MMSAIEELQRDMWGDRNITRKRVRKKTPSKKEQPAGFYKKGGKVRPITKAKPKTRVVKRNIPAPSPPVQPPPHALRGAHGWEFAYPSKSSNKVYTTTYWTEDHRQFKAGDITCNCRGWIYSKKVPKSCSHCDEVRQQAGNQAAGGHWRGVGAGIPSPTTASSPVGSSVASASPLTRAKFDKAVKGATGGIPGFQMDQTSSVALLVDPSEAIKNASPAISGFVQKLSSPQAPDKTYGLISQASLGKAVRNATDPKDSHAIFIGDTTFQKKVVKIALRTLGGKNIRVYSMGTDEPVFLVNDSDEAVLLAPYVAGSVSPSYDIGLLRLEDVAQVI